MSDENPTTARTTANTLYREVIDRLVLETQSGQGRHLAHQICEGDWRMGGEHERGAINHLLTHLAQPERELLGSMLTQAFIDGVHESLLALHDHGMTPFDNGYEGGPHQDYMGRLEGWAWPHEVESP